jgi:hypothetical protein
MPDRPTTHAPHVDDAMAADAEALLRGAPIEARAQEHRMVEPPDDEGAVEAILDFAADPLPGTLGEAERRRRSELAAALRPHAFPAERDELVRVAEREGAPEWVLDALEQLPMDTRFDTPQGVWEALGGHREQREVPEAHALSEVQVESEAVPAAAVPPEEARRAAVPPVTRSEPAASRNVWQDVGFIALSAARLPLAVLKWGGRAVLDRLPGTRAAGT